LSVPTADTDCRVCDTVTKILHYIVKFSGLSGKALDQEVGSDEEKRNEKVFACCSRAHNLHQKIEGVCQYLPAEYVGECDTIVSVVGLKLAECVAQQTKFNAKECCYDVSLCPKPSK
jgi:hypothetical protein